MLNIYGKISQELFCVTIMQGLCASGTSEGILLEPNIFDEVFGEEGFVAT